MNPIPWRGLRAAAFGLMMASASAPALAGAGTGDGRGDRGAGGMVAGAGDRVQPCSLHVGQGDARFAIHLEPIGADLWWVPARAGDADAANRGQVVNLVLARHQGRLWLLGSGPSPAFARALDCVARQRLGLPVHEVANPYARAELVLGNAGLPRARASAPAPVREAMREQCTRCVERLRQRLGEAAVDLGTAPVRLPRALPELGQGGAWQRWGPFDWRTVQRAERSWTSVWRHAGAGVTAAFGLLWFDGAPDGRDTEPARLLPALEAVLGGAAAGDRFVGDAGPPRDREDVERQLAYWRALWHAARQGVAAGGILPGEPPEAPAGWRDHERHRLSWQRAWRLAEDALLAEPLR